MCQVHCVRLRFCPSHAWIDKLRNHTGGRCRRRPQCRWVASLIVVIVDDNRSCHTRPSMSKSISISSVSLVLSSFARLFDTFQIQRCPSRSGPQLRRLPFHVHGGRHRHGQSQGSQCGCGGFQPLHGADEVGDVWWQPQEATVRVHRSEGCMLGCTSGAGCGGSTARDRITKKWRQYTSIVTE